LGEIGNQHDLLAWLADRSGSWRVLRHFNRPYDLRKRQ
jgi:hypothetical protein